MARRRQDDSDKFTLEVPFQRVEPILSKLPEFLSGNQSVSQDQEEPAQLRSDLSTPQTPNKIPIPSKEPQEQSTIARLKELYAAPPLLSESKPSKLRRFGAALAGGLAGASQGPEAGIKTAGGILQSPYREKYQDWATRTGALEKQANLEIESRKVESSGLSSLGSYLRSIGAIDPELQGDIEGRKTTAREKALVPGRESLEDKRQAGREAIEDIRTTRGTNLETYRQEGREGLEAKRQIGREKTEKDQITSREKIARDQILSRENIARLNRELRKQLSSAAIKNQRVPPSQQYLGRIMAEHEISQLISDPEEFDSLFNEVKDSSGRITYQLKSDRDVPAKWKPKYDDRKKEINRLLNELIKTSYSPSSESDTDDEEDQYDVEEIQ